MSMLRNRVPGTRFVMGPKPRCLMILRPYYIYPEELYYIEMNVIIGLGHWGCNNLLGLGSFQDVVQWLPVYVTWVLCKVQTGPMWTIAVYYLDSYRESCTQVECVPGAISKSLLLLDSTNECWPVSWKLLFGDQGREEDSLHHPTEPSRFTRCYSPMSPSSQYPHDEKTCVFRGWSKNWNTK